MSNCHLSFKWFVVASDEQSEKGKNMTKWKSDASNGSNTGDTNQGKGVK